MLVWVNLAFGYPPEETSCEDLARKLVTEKVPPRPAAPTYWWLEERPCPHGLKLGGPLPPAAREVWCEVGGERAGPATKFSGDFKVLQQTQFSHNDEVGPRVDWDPAAAKAVAYTEYDKDTPSGLTVEWTEGGTLVGWVKKGVKDGPTFKLDARGRVELVEYWRAGTRATRSCVWRDGALAIDAP